MTVSIKNQPPSYISFEGYFMQEDKLLPHLFRQEAGKIKAVLCGQFGLDHIELAEDITADTFLAALENWPYQGIPENPVAWLYAVAKNKTRNLLSRNNLFRDKILQNLNREPGSFEEPEIDLSEKNIQDSQLRMMYAVCNPAISSEAQITLALRTLCGFSIDEIAHAFITSKETISKRLVRAKEKLREEKIRIELPPLQEIVSRTENVLRTLYLLFSEGYYSETENAVIREDLCKEAMRLTLLLTRGEKTSLPSANALMALMCFHSSRLEARKGENGTLILYNNQDEKLWDRNLIAEGVFYLRRSASGSEITKYHLEANIAYWHTIREDSFEKWQHILQFYNLLLQKEYSVVAALNRTFALYKVKGSKEAIPEAEKLGLGNNPYYFSLLGEMYSETDAVKAKDCFQKAVAVAKTNADRVLLQIRIKELEK